MRAIRYPAPPVKYAGDSDLHFATEEQVRSRFALGNSDRGEISVAPGRITFRGMRVLVDCPHVTAVRLVRKAYPWGILLAVAAAAGILVYLNSPVPFTWRQPLPYIVAGILLVASVKLRGERWVEVVYRDDAGERRAYFRREPMWWGSGATRTRELYQELQVAAARGAGAAPAEPSAAPDAGMGPG